jgi:hypothetical protein
MGSVIECLTCAVDSEPMPVIGVNIVLVWPPWYRSLPEIPIKRRRNRDLLAKPNRLSRVAVPALAEVGRAYDSVSELVDGLNDE